MFNYILKRKILNNNLTEKNNRDYAIKLSAIFGLVFNIILFIIKLIIGIFVKSISIVSDSINNLSDSFTNIITILGTNISNKPADDEHPYGHGRSEYIVTLVVGIIIIVAGFQILINSIKSIVNPYEIVYSKYSIAILIFSILVKFYMYLINQKVGKSCKSELNIGLAKDSINDVISTFLVLVSIIVYTVYKINIDGYVGLFISILVIKTGIDLFIKMGSVLLGAKIEEEQLQELKKIILEGKYIKGVHDIEVHEYGKGRYFGSCHVEAPANIDVYSMHAIIHDLEVKVFEKTGIRISIHIDPKYLLEKDKFRKIEDESLLDEID